MKIFNFVKPYLLKWKSSLLGYTFFGILLWTTSILTPYITSKYIDYIEGVYKMNTSNKPMNGVYLFTTVLAAIWGIEILSTYFGKMSNAKLQCNTVYELNYSVLEHIKRLPILFFNKVDASYLNQRINSDATNLVSFVLNHFIQMFMKAITFIVCLVVLFSINVKITLILLVLIPIYMFIYKSFKKPIYSSSYECREQQNRLFSKMNEQINHIKFIKLNSFYKILGDQLNENFKGLYKATMNYGRVSYIFGSVDLFVGRLCNLLIFFYGGFEVIKGNLTIGNFININSYFVILLGCISFFLNIGKAYQDAKVSFERINELLAMEVEISGSKRLDSVNQIKFENVKFSYDNTSNIIKDFNYTFEKGNIYCIKGRNGIGKSTFLGLLTGLFNNTYEGKIRYDLIDLKEMDIYHLRENIIGVTEQEPILLGNTIMNNLTLGLRAVSSCDVENWCRELNINNFVDALPDRFDYNINDKASNVSGGQKQRISQARVMIKEPQVIIMDEPTSALDHDSIERLKTVLAKVKKDKIIIAITHNDSLLTIADEVINFEEIA